MHAAKDERRTQFKMGREMIGIPRLMEEFGMSRKEVEDILDGRN